MTTRTALYRHYDADGQLLYVGITACLSERDRNHEATSHWHGQVLSSRVEWHDSRTSAVSAERRAIRDEAPKFNVMHADAGTVPDTFLCAEIAEFAQEVLDFCERHCLKPATVLQKSCKNGRSWYAICDGKDMTMNTAARARQWMADQDAAREARA
ncbi:hypothetical protein J7354_01440 [Sulfitobacter sp. R18_2]|uniref:hypothetical protein n=1 Tax=Sulfitobacter sp. R18_2 TaxID=2821105 RepID=UPI001ADA929C|nr:hypothetical protein [Sulfitobacter sp. R18_2]MBO9437314.1 hypothetical protein [Sulfitobacter sp. R18_2]